MRSYSRQDPQSPPGESRPPEPRADADDPQTRWQVWMVAAQEGDAAAYERLLRSVLPELQRFVVARLRDPVASEDVVQNVLLSIHRARHTYRRERPFEPWLFAIARNAVIDAQRKQGTRARYEVALEHTAEPADPRMDELPRSPLARGQLQDALAQLPSAQREAVELVKLQELSVRDAAARVGISVGALKVRAHRGYRSLRRILEGGEG